MFSSVPSTVQSVGNKSSARRGWVSTCTLSTLESKCEKSNCQRPFLRFSTLQLFIDKSVNQSETRFGKLSMSWVQIKCYLFKIHNSRVEKRKRPVAETVHVFSTCVDTLAQHISNQKEIGKDFFHCRICQNTPQVTTFFSNYMWLDVFLSIFLGLAQINSALKKCRKKICQSCDKFSSNCACHVYLLFIMALIILSVLFTYTITYLLCLFCDKYSTWFAFIALKMVVKVRINAEKVIHDRSS